MLTVTYAECHIKAPYAECIYAECHYAECHYAECRGAFLQFVLPGGVPPQHALLLLFM